MSIFLLLTFIPSNSQVGIGTTTPRGILDLNSPLTSNSGLVLPTNSSVTNIINPQGGNIAEGTMMYDNTNKCVKYFNGTSWSNCLCDSCGGGAQPTVVVDCSQGFSGTYEELVPLSGATYSVTVTNNSFSTATLAFQPNDLVLSGVDGITVASVSPTSANLAAGASQVITYTLSGTPNSVGTLTGKWNKITLSCNNSVDVQGTIRLGFFGAGFPNLRTFIVPQLRDPANYGPTGTYVTDRKITFVDATSDIQSLSATALKAKYHILFISSFSILNNQILVQKVKDYVALGGVIHIAHGLFNGDTTPSVQNFTFRQFGNTGNVVSYESYIPKVSNSSATEELSNVFGDTRNVSFNIYHYARVRPNQLAAGSRVLATLTTGSPGDVVLWASKGAPYDGRVVWTATDIFSASPSITGSIDTPQERFGHNIIAYLLQQAGF